MHFSLDLLTQAIAYPDTFLVNEYITGSGMENGVYGLNDVEGQD